MTAEEVSSWIEAKGYTDVYRYALPIEPNSCIAVIPYPGRAGEHDFGSAELQRVRPRVQFLVRGEPDDSAEPASRANALMKDIGGMPVPCLLSGVMYSELIVLTSEPAPLPKDMNRCWTFLFNVEFYKDVS
jgi:hypothetical protein